MDTGWMLILHHLYEGAEPTWTVAFMGGSGATALLYMWGLYSAKDSTPRPLLPRLLSSWAPLSPESLSSFAWPHSGWE